VAESFIQCENVRSVSRSRLRRNRLAAGVALVAIELTLKLLVKLKVRLPPTVVFTDGASPRLFPEYSQYLVQPEVTEQGNSLFFSCGARASADCLWSRLGTK
jgi:hypothetical protein